MAELAILMEELCATCSAPLGGPYCGHCGAWNGEGSPPPEPDKVCPVCGTVNPPENLHCQACAYRLDRADSWPVDGSGSNRSVRLLALAAAVAAALTAVLLIGNWIAGSEEPQPSTPQATTETTADSATGGITGEQPQPIAVDSVSASSSFSDALGPQNLIDGDPGTYWNDASLHGEGAEIVLEFDEPVSIDGLVVLNVSDEVAFSRNFRIRGYEITTDDLPTPLVGELADTQEPQRIDFETTGSTVLRLRVTSTYPAESVGEQPAFEELAVAEVTVVGLRSGE